MRAGIASVCAIKNKPRRNFLKRFIMTSAASSVLAATVLVAIAPSGLLADPADDTLLIDGELAMTTRTESVEGHPLPEVISGWHYRTDETRVLERSW